MVIATFQLRAASFTGECRRATRYATDVSHTETLLGTLRTRRLARPITIQRVVNKQHHRVYIRLMKLAARSRNVAVATATPFATQTDKYYLYLSPRIWIVFVSSKEVHANHCCCVNAIANTRTSAIVSFTASITVISTQLMHQFVSRRADEMPQFSQSDPRTSKLLPYISYIGTFRQSGYYFQGPLS